MCAENRWNGPAPIYRSDGRAWYNSNMAKGKDAAPTGHVNLRMLADHLGLSQTTVSLVLNNSPSAKSIPQETRKRVEEAAERLDYRPNYFARSLRQSRSMSVGVLAPDLSEGYFTRVMSGVVQELTAAHYFYFTACHDWKPELIEKYPRMLVERAVDGFLLLNTAMEELAVPVPVVAISAHCAADYVTNIVLDHHMAVRQALEHLHKLGHRRIAIMRGPHVIPDSEFRWESIQQVAREMDLKLDPDLAIRIDAAGWSTKDGQHPMAPRSATTDAGAARKNARLHRGVLLQRHCGDRRHSRAEGRGVERAGRRFGGGVRRYYVGGLFDAFAHHGAPAAGGDGPARREGSAGANRRQQESVSGGHHDGIGVDDPRIDRAGKNKGPGIRV
jgi:hypothetical protein